MLARKTVYFWFDTPYRWLWLVSVDYLHCCIVYRHGCVAMLLLMAIFKKKLCCLFFLLKLQAVVFLPGERFSCANKEHNAYVLSISLFVLGRFWQFSQLIHSHRRWSGKISLICMFSHLPATCCFVNSRSNGKPWPPLASFSIYFQDLLVLTDRNRYIAFQKCYIYLP